MGITAWSPPRGVAGCNKTTNAAGFLWTSGLYSFSYLHIFFPRQLLSDTFLWSGYFEFKHRMLSRLRHPNIVTTLGFVQAKIPKLVSASTGIHHHTACFQNFCLDFILNDPKCIYVMGCSWYSVTTGNGVHGRRKLERCSFNHLSQFSTRFDFETKFYHWIFSIVFFQYRASIPFLVHSCSLSWDRP